MAGRYVSDTVIFEAVADALIRVQAPDGTKTLILAATMDQVGVPMLSVTRYKDDPAIVALFAERGVRIIDEADEAAEHLDELDPRSVLEQERDDARALAVALFSRLRDFIDDETVFGEGISWATLPDWISGDEAGRDMWKYGADDEPAINDTEGVDQP